MRKSRNLQFLLALLLGTAVLAGRAQYEGCGVESSHPEENEVLQDGRIVGGRQVESFRYPWFASLQMFGSSVCGGALIAPTFVLTAAHCFDLLPEEFPLERLFTITLGIMDMCQRSENTRIQLEIQRVVVHQKYKRRGKFNDIALIELASPAPARYTPVCLPPHDTRSAASEGRVLGLGVTEHEGEQPCNLQELDVNLYTTKQCFKSRLPLSVVSEPTILCAGHLEGGRDSCQGDSGGPLQVRGVGDRWVLRGVVSFGYGCAKKGLPGVYTSVAHFMSWLQSTAGSDTFPNSTLVES